MDISTLILLKQNDDFFEIYGITYVVVKIQ